MVKQAMVLAAGKGTRLGELTRHTPKPLVDLGGVTPLYRILKGFEHAGMERVVINCHWRAEKIMAAVNEWVLKNTFNMELILSYEEELLETGGGMKYALKHFKGEPFVVANGDIVWGEGFSCAVQDLTSAYKDDEMDFLLAMTPVEHTRKTNGDFRMYQDGRLDYLDEGELSSVVYCGLAVVHPRSINRLPEGFVSIHPAWREAAVFGKFYGFKHDYPWIDMGTPEGLEKAKDVIKKENGCH